MTLNTLKQTPLYQEQVELKAKMTPFGGWEMPLQYQGILAEYEATRRKGTVFDTSHMGEFLIEGDAVATGLDTIVSQRIQDMPLKTCRYGVALNEKGGVRDDLIVYRMQPKRWMIVVNGATMEKDAQHFEQHLRDKKSFRNISFQTGKLDIQGPLSREILSPLVKGIEKLEYYTFDYFDIMGENAIVSRTGYTGELGYEIYFPWEKTCELWREILKRGAQPAGLGARDVLRIEMGYSLYGHELEENIIPLDAGLERFIDWEKEFIGKAALQKFQNEGLSRKMVCLVSENRRSPRAEHKIYDQEKKEIGQISSGTFSPCLQRGLGLGFVQKPHGPRGEKVFFGDEDGKYVAEISTRPVYKEGSLKS